MLTEFLEDIQVMTQPEFKVWDEENETYVVTQEAQYVTQTILKTRPPTESQARLDMVIGLGKPQMVIDIFIDKVNLGIAWDFCDSYITYMNELDTWNKWVAPEPKLDANGEPLPVATKPDEPIAPIRLPSIVDAGYARKLFKAEREKLVKALTVEVDGMVFDGDEVAQQRMERQYRHMVKRDVATMLWVLADNTSIQVTAEQLDEASYLSGLAQSAVWGM